MSSDPFCRIVCPTRPEAEPWDSWCGDRSLHRKKRASVTACLPHHAALYSGCQQNPLREASEPGRAVSASSRPRTQKNPMEADLSITKRAAPVYHGTVHERKETGAMAGWNGNTDYLLLNRDVPMLTCYCRRSEYDEPEFFEDRWLTSLRPIGHRNLSALREHRKASPDTACISSGCWSSMAAMTWRGSCVLPTPCP